MKNDWKTTKLSEVLAPVSRREVIDPTKEYPLLGIRLDGGGPFHRETKLGSGIAARTLFKVRTGDFIYSRLFAWRGAFGIIRSDLNGCYVSGEFPTFKPNPDKLDVKFLQSWFRLPMSISKVQAVCTGSTPLTRNRFKEEFFLPMEVSLPSLSEQRRIVARIEQLAAQVHEARALRQQATKEAVVLDTSLLAHLIPWDAPKQTLGELIDPGSTISYGVLVPGPGIEGGVPFVRVQDLDLRNPPARPHKRIAPDVEAQYARTRLHGGEILVGVVGTIGKIGIAPPSWAGANVARAVCRIVPGPEIDRYYLAMALHSPRTQDYFRETTRTLAQPTLNVAQLEQTPIPVPQMPEQRRIAKRLEDLQGKLDKLKRVQSETAVELDALLPSILDKAFKGKL